MNPVGNLLKSRVVQAVVALLLMLFMLSLYAAKKKPYDQFRSDSLQPLDLHSSFRGENQAHSPSKSNTPPTSNWDENRASPKSTAGENAGANPIKLPSNLDGILPLASEKQTKIPAEEAANSATGKLFLGEKIRDFNGIWKFKGHEEGGREKAMKQADLAPNLKCSKWCVVTTIFQPTEAVKRAASLSTWCTVVVADTKTPKDYLQQAGLSEVEKSRFHFLSVEEQKRWASMDTAVGRFVRAIPYKHFARKNLGYLFAIQHGARFIFDFDDDNLLKKNSKGVVQPPIANEVGIEGARVVMLGKMVLNHHPLMGASLSNSWPRGFPLEFIQDNATQGSVAYENITQPVDSIAVMQFCADGDPDVDAIHRLVKPLPMTFHVGNSGSGSNRGALVVPPVAFAPYNAQANLHTGNALWALLLPYTVPGRVSDIWRGYFSQALFRLAGLRIAMMPPAVKQDRNAHDYLADMNAELDLYFKTGKLLEFLDSWNCAEKTIPACMETVWIEMYQRGYVKADDVKMVQLWLEALLESGYQFPKISRRRYNNIVLLGHFKAETTRNVIFWTQKWREIFRRVVAVGQFTPSALTELKTLGINANQTKTANGQASRLSSIVQAVEHFRPSGVDAVTYILNDALVNVSALFGDSSLQHRSQMIVATNSTDSTAKDAYRIHLNGTFSKQDGYRTNNVRDLIKSLGKWKSHKACLNGFRAVFKDSRSAPFLENDGSFLVTPPALGLHLMVVPMDIADEFITAAKLMMEHKVVDECAISKLIHLAGRLSKEKSVQVKHVPVCTSSTRQRVSLETINKCIANSEAKYATFQPYPINVHGMQNWSMAFDLVNRR